MGFGLLVWIRFLRLLAVGKSWVEKAEKVWMMSAASGSFDCGGKSAAFAQDDGVFVGVWGNTLRMMVSF